MLENTFIAVLNMSITALVAAVLIIFFRWIFGNKLPRIFSYALWAIVLVRLLIPFSLPSMFSIFNAIPVPETIMSQSQQYYGTSNNITYSTDYGSIPQENTVSDALNNINDSFPAATPEASVDPMQVIIFVISRIWLAGAAGLLSFSIFAYFRALLRLKEAVLYNQKDLIFQCSRKLKLNRNIQVYTSDRVHTPVVCGLIKARIILPLDLTQGCNELELKHIITHELVHIKRFDYILKPLSMLALCVHWFNPVMWVVFILSQKDMEMSCDEKVMSVFDNDIRSEYAASLIKLAAKQNVLLNGGLLAFGESNIKSRIKGIMNFKKSGFWLGTTAVVIFVAIGMVLLTNGKFADPIVIDELRTVIPDTLEVTKTISDYTHGQHVVQVEGRFKSSDKELYLTFIANDVKGGGQLEDGIRRADEIKPLDDGWFSFRHKLIETTGEVTYTKNVTIIFHLKRDGKNDKGLLTVPAKQPPGIPAEPKDESGDTNNNDRDNKGWEVIGARADRVQGTITELDITDGILNSVTLIGTKRIMLPNNPIDYDFAGQTFHIEFNEELTKAGDLKDKLKKGAEIVVTFAQYAIPPNGKNPGKTILGAYLSEIYYVENGKYYDVQGKEVDLLPSSDIFDSLLQNPNFLRQGFEIVKMNDPVKIDKETAIKSATAKETIGTYVSEQAKSITAILVKLTDKEHPRLPGSDIVLQDLPVWIVTIHDVNIHGSGGPKKLGGKSDKEGSKC
ncbi:MAG: M56 family metallopeptidase [Sedimentibacter sp.]